MNIPMLGFIPLNNLPVLAHSVDEYIPIDQYIRGIDIYKTLIAQLANFD